MTASMDIRYGMVKFELLCIQLSINTVIQKKSAQHTKQNIKICIQARISIKMNIFEKDGSIVEEKLSTTAWKAIIEMFLSMK